MEPSATPKGEKKATAKVTTALFEAGATTMASLPPPTVPEVAFAGRSNVGKSSLMNTLLERKALVRTSSTPGCTRAINLFAVGLGDGASYRMVDLPGYGYAKLSKAEKGRWGEMIEAYLRQRATLRAVVVLVDIRRGFEADDLQLIDFIATCHPAGSPLPCIPVATKLDKFPLSKRKPALAALKKATPQLSPIGFSALEGDGRDALWARIRGLADGQP